MPKSDNKHAVNMYNGIEQNIGQAAADEFSQALPLSKSADYIKKSKWAEGVCAWLEENYSDDAVRKIRMACACSPGSKSDRVKAMFEASKDNADFCERFNKEYAPGNIMYCEGDSLFLTYPECYCSCVKRDDKLLSKTWCYCSLGYVDALYSHALSRKVQVDLLESVKTGGSKCVMKIT